MYWARLGRDYVLWMLGIVLHILLRIFVIFCVPFLLFGTMFTLVQSRQTNQISFDLATLFSLKIARPPRIDWSRLPFLRRRNRASDRRVVAGEVLPPLEDEPADLRRIGKRK